MREFYDFCRKKNFPIFLGGGEVPYLPPAPPSPTPMLLSADSMHLLLFYAIVFEIHTKNSRRTCSLQGKQSIESAYATTYWSSIVTLVLSCPVSEILHCSKQRPPRLFNLNLGGLFPWTRSPMLGLL